jgi:hypothetical protein
MTLHRSAWEEAARSLGVEPAPLRRPDPARWVWYAFWGPLPARYALWVLYDATCWTWVPRHLARILTVLALPVAALAIFLPGPARITVSTALVAGFFALLFTAVWINEGLEYRLQRAGWRPGIASVLRERRAELARR